MRPDAVFLSEGSVTTRTPARTYHETNSYVGPLTPGIIKQKKYLQAMRGLPQTHTKPREWAANLYVALEVACNVDALTVETAMQDLFKVYDPISRMFTADRFSRRVFDSQMATYHNPLAPGLDNLRNTAKIKLQLYGMPQDKIALVEQAAQSSGLAIYNELHRLAYPQLHQ